MLLSLLLGAVLVAIGLGFAAFAAAPKRPENRAFALFQWLSALWAANDLAFWGLPGPGDAQRWARAALLLALALQLAFLRFAWTFPGSRPTPPLAGGVAALVCAAAAVPVLGGRAFGEVGWREGRFVVEVTPWTFSVGAVVYAAFLGGIALLVRRWREAKGPVREQLLRFLLAALTSAGTTTLAGVALPLLGEARLLPLVSLGILLGSAVHFHSLARLGFLRPAGPVDPRRGLPVTAKLAAAAAAFTLAAALLALLAARLAVGPAGPGAWDQALVLGLLAASFPAMGLILVAQRVVTRPLAEITAAAMRVSGGESGVRVPVPSRGDEVALLARALDEMIERLEREREAERELAEKLRRTERLSLAGSLAAGVAHEVNNPLAAVSSLVQLVAERAPEGDDRARLHDALHQIDRIAAALRELLDLARPGPRARARIDLADVIERTARLVRFDRRFRGIPLDVACEAGLAVDADGDQLSQVLLNLLLNAADALAESGGRSVRVRGAARGGEVVLEVEDDGPGMPPEVRARLFEPFFTTKPAGTGTGLGLAVCRDLVREHGGRIEVDSEPGRGTRVRVILPAAGGASA